MGIDAPVFDTDCTTRLAGAAYLAQVYVGLAPGDLSPIGWVLPFRTGDAAGYITMTVLTVTGSSGTLVYSQLRAWEALSGGSYEAAVAAGGKHGVSNVVPIRTVMPPGAPDVPVGLESFCLVPEPAPVAFMAWGGAALAAASQWRRPPAGASAGPSSRESAGGREADAGA